MLHITSECGGENFMSHVTLECGGENFLSLEMLSRKTDKVSQWNISRALCKY